MLFFSSSFSTFVAFCFWFYRYGVIRSILNSIFAIIIKWLCIISAWLYILINFKLSNRRWTFIVWLSHRYVSIRISISLINCISQLWTCVFCFKIYNISWNIDLYLCVLKILFIHWLLKSVSLGVSKRTYFSCHVVNIISVSSIVFLIFLNWILYFLSSIFWI